MCVLGMHALKTKDTSRVLNYALWSAALALGYVWMLGRHFVVDYGDGNVARVFENDVQIFGRCRRW